MQSFPTLRHERVDRKAHLFCVGICVADTILDSKAVEFIAEALKVPGCSLISLDLSSNEISDDGVVALANALKAAPRGSLRTLNVLRNCFGVDGAKAVIAAYEQSHTLQSLCGLALRATKLN